MRSLRSINNTFLKSMVEKNKIANHSRKNSFLGGVVNNVGSFCYQIITNGNYRSCVHRVITNPDKQNYLWQHFMTQQRQSRSLMCLCQCRVRCLCRKTTYQPVSIISVDSPSTSTYTTLSNTMILLKLNTRSLYKQTKKLN